MIKLRHTVMNNLSPNLKSDSYFVPKLLKSFPKVYSVDPCLLKNIYSVVNDIFHFFFNLKKF